MHQEQDKSPQTTFDRHTAVPPHTNSLQKEKHIALKLTRLRITRRISIIESKMAVFE